MAGSEAESEADQTTPPPLTQEGKELPHLDTHLREIVGGFGIADKLLNGTVDGL